jgi:very-short-patch-repair endonuclease
MPVGPAQRHTGEDRIGACDIEPVDRRVAGLAARQHGVVTRSQLAGAGLTRHGIQHRVDAGRLHRLHRSVFAVGHTGLTPAGVRLAAVLASGPGAVLSHRSAPSTGACCPPVPRSSTSPVGSRAGAGPQGVVLHHTRELGTTDVRERHGIPVTSPARTLLDLAATASLRELEHAVNEARIARLLDRPSLDALVTASAGARGHAALRTVLSGGPGVTRSTMERRLLGLVRRAGLPRPRTNVKLLGRHEVDALWPDRRVAVEVDGYAVHSGRDTFENDRRRDGDLLAAGYRILRVTWLQLRDEPEAVVARLAAVLARSAGP